MLRFKLRAAIAVSLVAVLVGTAGGAVAVSRQSSDEAGSNPLGSRQTRGSSRVRTIARAA